MCVCMCVIVFIFHPDCVFRFFSLSTLFSVDRDIQWHVVDGKVDRRSFTGEYKIDSVSHLPLYEGESEGAGKEVGRRRNARARGDICM